MERAHSGRASRRVVNPTRDARASLGAGRLANELSLALVVGMVSYMSIVLGELVPKSLALRSSGIELQVSRAAISATNAPADVAKALEIQRDDVLLRFASQLYDSKGTVVDYSVSYFIPGYFNFHVNRRIGKS